MDEGTEQAERITTWLARHGIEVRLLKDAVQESESLLKTGTPIKLVRLWTQAAHRYWEGKPESEQHAAAQNLILRTEEVDLPSGINPQNNCSTGSIGRNRAIRLETMQSWKGSDNGSCRAQTSRNKKRLISRSKRAFQPKYRHSSMKLKTPKPNRHAVW